MNTYQGKMVLVTGASSGIGLEMSKALAARGANVIITARSEGKLNALADELRQTGVEAHVFAGDLSQTGTAQALFDWTVEQGLTVDLLINNAGYGKWGKFSKFDRDTYNNMIQLNINALTELCHLFVEGMAERGDGGIINVGSTASFVPVPYSAVYGATKAYVIMLSEALNAEYRDRGVHVMTLCPGATESGFQAVAGGENAEISGADTSEFVAVAGLDAFLEGKLTIITGRQNQMMGLFPRFLSRQQALNMVVSRTKERFDI